MVTVPQGFADATVRREGDAGRRWVASLPALAAEFLARWRCVESGPVMHGWVGLVVPVTRSDGLAAVLKLGFPLSYDTGEASALAAWNGVGAARLLERDDFRFAMLLERLDPLPGPVPAPFTTVGRLVRRLAIPAPPGIPSLAAKGRSWLADVPAHAARLGHPLPRRVVDACLANVRALVADPPSLLVHGDLHFGNILRSGPDLRVIDPSGFAGDPAFELLPLLRAAWPAIAAEPHPSRAADHRIAEFADAADLDRDRVRRWAQARAAESALWARELGEPRWVTEIVDTLASILV